MSFLTEKPPENLEVNGEKYPINTDFRTVLRYMEVVEDADETLADIERCLQILYKIPPPRNDIAEAVKQATWFVKCGKKEKKGKPSKKILGINSNEALNFKEDAWLIYSAFPAEMMCMALIYIPFNICTGGNLLRCWMIFRKPCHCIGLCSIGLLIRQIRVCQRSRLLFIRQCRDIIKSNR